MTEPKRLILCEGYEDAAFFKRLIAVRGLPPAIVIEAGGNTVFRKALNDFKVSKTRVFNSLEKILVVADNDEDPAASFANVRTQIEQMFGNGTAPNAPLQKKVTRSPTLQIEISVLMVPWTGEKGHLEKMCVEAARESNRQIGNHVDTFLDLIHAANWANESRHGKAWLRTNLAARSDRDPFVALGDVFNDPRYQPLIPVDHPSFNPIADTLRALGTASIISRVMTPIEDALNDFQKGQQAMARRRQQFGDPAAPRLPQDGPAPAPAYAKYLDDLLRPVRIEISFGDPLKTREQIEALMACLTEALVVTQDHQRGIERQRRDLHAIVKHGADVLVYINGKTPTGRKSRKS